MRRYYFLYIVLLISTTGFGQKKLLRKVRKKEFKQGAYISSSKKVSNTFLYYDDATNILFEKVDKKNIVPHTANSISSFEITEDGEKRVFYTLPFDVQGNGKVALKFFEILFEENNIAVLKYYALIKKDKTITTFTEADGNISTGAQNNNIILDKIFLVKGDTGIKEFLSRDGGIINFYKIVDKSLLGKFFGKYINQV